MQFYKLIYTFNICFKKKKLSFIILFQKIFLFFSQL